ncbi:MAG: DUF4253 domain-containing protein [Anaerolineae bacterium]|nr:DUF4253 domain-containing protein [Anaerolineae bacterium]
MFETESEDALNEPSRIGRRLATRFTLEEQVAIVTELGTTIEELELIEGEPRLSVFFDLVLQLRQQNRVEQLLAACERHKPGVIRAPLPSTEWSVKVLSPEIILRLNQALAASGKLYFVKSNWSDNFEITGCFCWLMNLNHWFVLGASEQVIVDSVQMVRAILMDEAVVVYASESEWAWQVEKASHCIVVAQTSDQFDILRIEQTADGNYGIGTADIIEELQIIDEKYGIDIVAANWGSVRFRLKRILEGEELADFTRWLSDFAPDVLGWDKEIPTEWLNQPITLWWD